jgi:hypothetical protein
MIHAKMLLLKPDSALLQLDFAREFSRCFHVDEVLKDATERQVFELIDSSDDEIEDAPSHAKHQHHHHHHHHHHKHKHDKHAKEKKEEKKKRKRQKELADMMASNEEDLDESERRTAKMRKLDATTSLGWNFRFIGRGSDGFDTAKHNTASNAPLVHSNDNNNNTNELAGDELLFVSTAELPQFLSILFVEDCYRRFEEAVKEAQAKPHKVERERDRAGGSEWERERKRERERNWAALNEQDSAGDQKNHFEA